MRADRRLARTLAREWSSMSSCRRFGTLRVRRGRLASVFIAARASSVPSWEPRNVTPDSEGDLSGGWFWKEEGDDEKSEC